MYSTLLRHVVLCQREIIYNFDLSLDAMRRVYLIKVNFSQMTQHIIDLSRC